MQVFRCTRKRCPLLGRDDCVDFLHQPGELRPERDHASLPDRIDAENKSPCGVPGEGPEFGAEVFEVNIPFVIERMEQDRPFDRIKELLAIAKRLQIGSNPFAGERFGDQAEFVDFEPLN